MDTSEHSPAPPAEITVAELEARFETEVLPAVAGLHPDADFSCACAYLF